MPESHLRPVEKAAGMGACFRNRRVVSSATAINGDHDPPGYIQHPQMPRLGPPCFSGAHCACVGALKGRLHCAMRSGETRSEEHTSELQSRFELVCRLPLEKKNKQQNRISS